jgi:hypothetical protein
MYPRFFNTTGPCFPDRHYMTPPLARLKGVEKLIAQGQYFVIHAPRQSGKTTYAYALMEKLNSQGSYTALQVNIQSAASGESPSDAMRIAATAIYDQALRHLPPPERPPAPHALNWKQLDGVRSYLGGWALQNPKPLVLLIDEADSLQDELFLTLLRQLRAGFESRPAAFPHSIALIGLRDVRDYQIQLRPDSLSLGTGSPFNIKAESFFIDSFSNQEVQALLEQHTAATGQPFEPAAIAEIQRLSGGQPWLVNALANHIVSRILDDDYRQPITVALVQQARDALIQRRDTHLDSLMDKLREPRVRAVVSAVINGSTPDFDHYNDAILYARNLGIIAPEPPVRFANPVYQEIIPRVLNLGFQESIPQDLADPLWYIRDGKLNMDALLQAFQKFYRRHSEAWLEKYDFREAGRQLLVMAFLQRIINGGGSIEREMAVGNGRTDLVIHYGEEIFVLELKLKHRSDSEEEGREQLTRYLDRLGVNHGYLLLFELDPAIPWEQRLRWQSHPQAGKEITLVGM